MNPPPDAAGAHPSYPPPPAPSGAIDLGTPGYGAPLHRVGPSRRGRTWAAVAASALAFAMVATGGVFVGARLWAGSTGALPEDVVPASTAAFVRLDLSPGYDQRLKFATLLERLPGEGSAEDRLADIRGELIDSIGHGLTRAEVEPWLGDRLGVGVWSDGGEPVLLVAAASEDDEAATRALTALRASAGADHVGFVVSDGYALATVGENGARAQAAAEAAAREARAGSLAADEAFRTATDRLPGDQPLLGYVDLPRTGKLLKRAGTGTDVVEELGAAGDLFGGAGLPDLEDGLDALTGQLVVGARAADNGIEIRTRWTGAPRAASDGPDARSDLDAMPGTSLAAAVISDARLGESLADLAGAGLGTAFADVDREAALGEVAPDVAALIDALRAVTLAGVSVTDVGDDLPGLSTVVRTRDEASAARLADAWAAAAGPDGAVPAPVSLSRDGDRLELATPGHRPEGRLADVALYREAMAGMPARPFGALYVDARALVAELGPTAESSRKLAPVAAVAAAVGRDGGDTTALVRIVIR